MRYNAEHEMTQLARELARELNPNKPLMVDIMARVIQPKMMRAYEAGTMAMAERVRVAQHEARSLRAKATARQAGVDQTEGKALC